MFLKTKIGFWWTFSLSSFACFLCRKIAQWQNQKVNPILSFKNMLLESTVQLMSHRSVPANVPGKHNSALTCMFLIRGSKVVVICCQILYGRMETSPLGWTEPPGWCRLRRRWPRRQTRTMRPVGTTGSWWPALWSGRAPEERNG